MPVLRVLVMMWVVAIALASCVWSKKKGGGTNINVDSQGSDFDPYGRSSGGTPALVER